MTGTCLQLDLDRRVHKRHAVTVDVFWHGRNGRSRGTVSDIGHAGCFVLSGDEVSDGETVHVFLPIGGGMKAQFTGVVTNHEESIGFAVRFDHVTEPQREILERLIGEHTDV